jgi:hypothetical protein
VDRGRSETDGQQAAISQDLDERAKGGKLERAEKPNSAKGDLSVIEIQRDSMLTPKIADKHHVHAKEVRFAGSHSDM